MLEFFNSAADRQAVIDREAELNQVLEDVCATWSNCRFDNYLTYNYTFTRAMVSAKLDYFHPQPEGPGHPGHPHLAGVVVGRVTYVKAKHRLTA